MEYQIYVTPFAGVWIEIDRLMLNAKTYNVTPFAGVWIEILSEKWRNRSNPSLPSRECGLKSQQGN